MHWDAKTDARFWANVDQSGGPNACWPWTRWRNAKGYGQFSLNSVHIQAPRASWMRNRGTIPDGLLVLHRCDNPPCVNPAHLFLGTARDNTHDMMRKGRAKPPIPEQGWNVGSRHPLAKLGEGDIPRIHELHAAGLLHREIAARFNVSRQAIGLVLNGKRWKHPV